MKTIKQLLTTIAVLLCSVMAHAYDFEVDGIYYNIISSSDLTAEVTKGDNEYSGEITIPSTITYKSKTLTITKINENAFTKSNITNVIIPNSITSIDDYTFYYCRSLTTITIPNSVTSIGKYAFGLCNALTSITIPNSVTSIGDFAFDGCGSLTTINIPNNIIEIGDYTFRNCFSISKINIPNNINFIGKEAFEGCTSLRYLKIEDGLKNLSFDLNCSAFSSCPLDSVYLGRDIFFYDDYNGKHSPFYNNAIKTLIIGYYVKEIDKYTFSGCKNISTIYLNCINPPLVETNNFTNSHYLNTTVYVPKGTFATYQVADIWKEFWDIQEYEVPEVPDAEIKKCSTPIINYDNGKLTITSETEGAEFVTEIKNNDIKKHYDNIIELTVTYNITSYAKLEGYANSDIATATLCWIETENTPSDLTQIESIPVIISSQNHNIIIKGVMINTEITIYDINGTKICSEIATSENIEINTTLNKNDIAIVHIGTKIVKIFIQ